MKEVFPLSSEVSSSGQISLSLHLFTFFWHNSDGEIQGSSIVIEIRDTMKNKEEISIVFRSIQIFQPFQIYIYANCLKV